LTVQSRVTVRTLLRSPALLLGIGLAALAGTGRTGLGQAVPIAIVPVDGVKVTGAMDVAEGKAVIGAQGSITAGEHAATVTLPHRGNLKLCPTTKVSLTSDAGVPSAATTLGETPGLMMAMDSGAIEASFATGHNSDVILTPDFRILISGPGTAAVQVRLGMKGDTCVDNRGPNAAYVTVSSIFEGGIYRVQPDQRVMFQHGSLREVVDQEKESCGCPPETPKSPAGNEFPIAQSMGMAPTPVPSNVEPPGKEAGQVTTRFSYDGTKPGQPPVSGPSTASTATPVAPTLAAPPPPAKPIPKSEEKHGFFGGIGHFFKKLFGG
jgi:hypothetical protein